MTGTKHKEKATKEAANMNTVEDIVTDIDPIDNPIITTFTDEGNGVKSFVKTNGDKFLTGPSGVHFVLAGKSVDSAQAVCGQLEVIGRYRDKQGNGWGRMVAWHDWDGTRHELKISEGDLSTKQNEVFAALASGGLEIFVIPSSGRPNRVIDFIRSYPREALPLLRSTPSFGWYELGHAFLLPSGVIGETINGESVIFDGNESAAPKYSAKGTLKEWQDTVGRIAQYSDRIAFFMCIGFAAPLCRLVNEPTGGFHLKGESSLGKSSANRALCSLFASAMPLESAEMATWKTSDNGFEGPCQTHTDLPLICEEMGQASAKTIAELLYMIGNETGKRRMTKSLQNRQIASWRLMMASSGELTAEELAAKNNIKVQDGVRVRLANIDVVNKDGMGVFDFIPDGETAKDLADKLRMYTESRYYGTAGPEYLKCLVADIKQVGLEAFTKNLHEGLSSFQTAIKTDKDPMVERVARRFALVAVAGELAISYGILPWEKDRALKAAITCFNVWRKGFRSKLEQEEDFIEYVLSYPEIHRERFDIVEVDELTPSGANNQTRFDNRLGVIVLKEDGDSRVYYLPKMFETEVLRKCDYSKDKGLKVLKENGLLIGSPYLYKVPAKGMRGLEAGRYVCIKMRAVEAEEVENAAD